MLKTITRELKHHVPFTLVGTFTGSMIMLLFVYVPSLKAVSEPLFWGLHPMHVLLSAVVTAGMYRLHSKGRLLPTIVIGYLGSIGIATISDSLIPYVTEWMLGLPHLHAHVGFIEKWWLVNPLAVAGILIAYFHPTTRFPHAGHVLLSTWASLFHMTMAMGEQVDAQTMLLLPVFLFIAVWVPCCTSDIVFPLLFTRRKD